MCEGTVKERCRIHVEQDEGKINDLTVNCEIDRKLGAACQKSNVLKNSIHSCISVTSVEIQNEFRARKLAFSEISYHVLFVRIRFLSGRKQREF